MRGDSIYGGLRMEEKIVYFEKPGEVNTPEVLSLVKERAKEREITTIVLASTRGETARAAADALEGSGIKLVVVPWQYGFGEPNPFPRELVAELEGKGHKVHFGTMLFHTEDFYGINTPKAMANLLRIFGQGTKVCVEIIMMACDGGCIEAGEKIIAVAGSHIGADTAVVASASPSNKLTRLRIHEIICKPLLVRKKTD
jgi:hypothetical protein